MKNVITLIKAIFLNSFRGEGGNKRERINNLLGMLISGGVFAVLFAVMTVFMGPIFAAQGLAAEFLAMIFTASQVIVLIFGTVVLINVMFFSKDAEMLLYLPLKPVTIFSAKIIYVYLTELALSAFMVAVIGTVFGIVCGFAAGYYPLLLLSLPVVPMVPLIIAALLSVPLMYIISFFKNKSVMSSLLLVAIFGIFMYFYMSFFGRLSNIEEGTFTLPAEQIKNSMKYMLPNIALARIVTLSSASYLIDILYVLAFTVGLFFIALLISSFTFRRGMANQLEESRSVSKGGLKFESNSVFKSILIKDAIEIIRNPGLAFYCLFQIIVAPILMVFYSSLLVNGDEIMSEQMFTGIGYLFTVLMVIGVNYTAMSSISREGANFYMMKTLPIPYSLQIKAKVRLADIVTLSGIVLCCAVMILLMNSEILSVILFFGFAVILSGAFNSFLVYLDAKSPKLNWESIAAALKNNKNSFISMGISMAIGLPLFIGNIIINELPQNLQLPFYAGYWLLFYAVAIIMNVAFKKMLANNAERLILQQE
jgi:ABC-2 type transport system permease protein